MAFVAQKVSKCFRVTLTSLNYRSVLYFKISSWVRSKKGAIFFFSVLRNMKDKQTKNPACSIFSRLNMKYFIQFLVSFHLSMI